MTNTNRCLWCGQPLPRNSRECEKHWQLYTRIADDPPMAKIMLAEIERRRIQQELEKRNVR